MNKIHAHSPIIHISASRSERSSRNVEHDRVAAGDLETILLER